MARITLLVSALALLVLGTLAPAAAQDATPAAIPGAAGRVEVRLMDVAGQEVGRATVWETADGTVTLTVEVQGLTPGEHGIHVHAVGLCDPAGDPSFASAGGHYNPTGATHGGPPTLDTMPSPAAGGMASPVAGGHAGDLGNIMVDEAGTGRLEITTDRFGLAELGDPDGSALVIHADRDDLQTDPSGNSGGRIVCGVIVAAQDGATPLATPVA